MNSSSPRRLLLALLAGLAAGLALSGLPVTVGTSVLAVFSPVGQLWVNAIRATVVPLVVALLVRSLASPSPLTAIGTLGRRTLVTFAGLMSAAAIFGAITSPFLFRLLPVPRTGTPFTPADTVAAHGTLPGFGEWFANLLPPNPIAAAAGGAMLPVILFTVIFALAASRLTAQHRGVIVGAADALAETMLVIVRWVIVVAPIGIFCLVLSPAAHLGVSFLGAVGSYIVAITLALSAFAAVLYPIVLIAADVPLRRFARGVLPAQTVALSSSSSLASLPALIEGAHSHLGIPAAIGGFVLPLSVAVLKVATPVSWTVATAFVSALYGVELTSLQLATVALTAGLLSFSIPGVPNAAFLTIAPVFVGLGLPPESLGLLIAVDAVPDLIGTMTNVTGDLAACAIVARAPRSTATIRE